MSSIIQAPHSIQYDGEMAKDLILRPSINVGLLSAYFKIITDLKTKRQVIYVHPLNKITVIDPGCGSTPTNKGPVREQKWWDPTNVEALLSQCYTDLYGTIHEAQLKPGNDKPYLEGTEVEQFLLDLLTPAAERDRMRMAWLSRKAISAGQLTNGSADVKHYNQIDGFQKRIEDGVTAGKIAYYEIAKNDALTLNAQKLAVDEALEILEGVYYNAGLLFQQMPDEDKVFFVTRSIYNNYKQTLTKNKALESSWMELQKGKKTLTFMGIPLLILDAVDAAIASDFVINGKADLPHRVVLTMKDNLQIAFDTDPSVIAFDAWDEKKDKTWYARLLYKLDTQIAFEEYVSVGY